MSFRSSLFLGLGVLLSTAGLASAQSDEDISRLIEKLKKECTPQVTNIDGKKGVLYEKKLGSLTTDTDGYDQVTIGFHDYESEPDRVKVGGVVQKGSSANFHFVVDEYKNGKVDGKPDKSVRKNLSLAKMLEMIKSDAKGDYSYLGNFEFGNPDYSSRCLYSGAVLKALK